MERKLKARSFSVEDISDIDARNGQFHVTSSSGKKYEVNFGAHSEMPSCECKDWIRFHMPCKHFFAVFNNRQQWKWDSLPSSYLQSAYLSQDTEALVEATDNVGDLELEKIDDLEGNNGDGEYDNLPTKVCS